MTGWITAASVNALGVWPSVFHHRRNPVESIARCQTPPAAPPQQRDAVAERLRAGRF